ncbi:hypothetical protein MKEN_01399200 [Mycena kentingensis (nom. inval.)]|nr:hypothetical protein MKEN_01399200 [Mycena kentingensis (nom. inval.)]
MAQDGTDDDSASSVCPTPTTPVAVVLSEPVLPPELEREIFCIAAKLSPRDLPTLLRVAKRVLEWLRPQLYTTISIKPKSPSMLALLRLIKSFPPNDPFFADPRVAQSVFVGPERWLGNETLLILRRFPGIRDLTMLSASQAVVPPPRENYTTHAPRDLPRAPAKRQHRHSPREYRLFDFLHEEPQDAWTYLFSSPALPNATHLPSLTHLCLHSFVHRAQLLMVLEYCPNLCVLVNVHQNTEPEWGLADIGGRLAIKDVRFVLTNVEVSLAAHGRRWEAARTKGHETPQDFWVAAERFVEMRRAGKIEPATRCWITPEDGLLQDVVNN